MVTSSSAHHPASDMVLFFFMTIMLHYHLLDFWWCQEEAAMSPFVQRLEDLKGCWMRKRDQLSRWSTGWGNFSQSAHAVQGDWAGRYHSSACTGLLQGTPCQRMRCQKSSGIFLIFCNLHSTLLPRINPTTPNQCSNPLCFLYQREIADTLAGSIGNSSPVTKSLYQ